MKKWIKQAIKGAMTAAGLEVKRTGAGLLGRVRPTDKYIVKVGGYPLKFGPSKEDQFKWVQQLNIKTILDIGAHTGEFALEIHSILPDAYIYSFEPLADCFEQLKANLKDLTTIQAFNLAIGDKSEETTIYHNDFSACSSLLEGGETLKKELPFARNVHQEVIKMETLDNVSRELRLEKHILVKIDVQGFEDKVIAGGMNTLRHARVIIVETSFREIYRGQPLFSNVYQALVEELGFVYMGSWAQLRSPTDGAPFQEDSIFIRYRS